MFSRMSGILYTGKASAIGLGIFVEREGYEMGLVH